MAHKVPQEVLKDFKKLSISDFASKYGIDESKIKGLKSLSGTELEDRLSKSTRWGGGYGWC